MALTVAEDKECDAAVKVSLTAAIGNNARATASHFHRVLRVLRGGVTLALQLCSRRDLTPLVASIIVPA